MHGLVSGFQLPIRGAGGTFFSKIKHRKSHYRSPFTDEHLQLNFMTRKTNSELHLSKMLSLEKRILFFSLVDLYYKYTHTHTHTHTQYFEFCNKKLWKFVFSHCMGTKIPDFASWPTKYKVFMICFFMKKFASSCSTLKSAKQYLGNLKTLKNGEIDHFSYQKN